MEVLERSLCLRMKEEEGKFLVNGGLEVAHGCALKVRKTTRRGG